MFPGQYWPNNQRPLFLSLSFTGYRKCFLRLFSKSCRLEGRNEGRRGDQHENSADETSQQWATSKIKQRRPSCLIFRDRNLCDLAFAFDDKAKTTVGRSCRLLTPSSLNASDFVFFLDRGPIWMWDSTNNPTSFCLTACSVGCMRIHCSLFLALVLSLSVFLRVHLCDLLLEHTSKSRRPHPRNWLRKIRSMSKADSSVWCLKGKTLFVLFLVCWFSTFSQANSHTVLVSISSLLLAQPDCCSWRYLLLGSPLRSTCFLSLSLLLFLLESLFLWNLPTCKVFEALSLH